MNCEICQQPASIVLQRQVLLDNESEAPRHPRCAQHLAPGSAYKMDGLDEQALRLEHNERLERIREQNAWRDRFGDVEVVAE